MSTKLYRKRAGKPLKHDFSGLRVGQAKAFEGSAIKNPYPYAAYWNENNAIKIEVWRDIDGKPYAKRTK